jgi:DNA repair exonuclease SbcCD ATPase subunit
MLNRRERKTQKTLLKQREDSRAQAEALASQVERLKGDINVLAGEEIRKATAASNEALRVAEMDRDRALRERDALLKDFDSAIARRLDDTQKELDAIKAKLAAAQKEVLGLVGRNAKLTEELDLTSASKNLSESLNTGLKKELETLKMEDVKALRKRIQTKTARVEELERELAQAKSRTPAGPVAPAMPGLSAMLNAKLRRKLQRDGKVTVETAIEPPAAPNTP